MVISLFRAGDWYTSLDQIAVPGGDLWLSLAPDILLRDEAKQWRRSDPAPVALDRIRSILIDAARLFRSGTVEIGGMGPQSFADFAAAMCQISGLPEVLTNRWADALVDELVALPDPGGGAGRATLSLVWLPSNSFTTLVAVGEALLAGGAVWMRPSHREPLSSARLVAALVAAGWPADRIAYLPTANALLAQAVRLTDRQIVYGGPTIAAALPSGPQLWLRGPGRGCAIVPAGAAPDPTARWLAGLIAADAGRFCHNVRTVACLGDPEPIATALGSLLDSIATDRIDPRWPQATLPVAQARRIATAIEADLGPQDRRLTRRDLIQPAGHAAVLAPTLVQLRWAAQHPLLGYEPPFPFAAVVAVDDAGAELISASSRYVYRPAEGIAR